MKSGIKKRLENNTASADHHISKAENLISQFLK